MVGAIIGAAAQVGSSIYGAIKSSQANKRAEQLLKNQRDENQKWYDQQMAADYTQRTDVQNILRKQRELFDEQYQKAKAANVVGGGTDESLALQKAAANEAMGETMADIAAQASDYKDSVEEQYRAKDDALNQQQIANERAKAQNIAAAAGQMGSAVSGLMNNLGAGASKAAGAATDAASASAGAKTGIDNTPAYTQKSLDEAVANHAKAALANGPAEVMGVDELPKKRV